MYNFKQIFNPIIRRLFETIFNATSGHDHDGTNSKAVTTGTPADNAVTTAKILNLNVTTGKIANLAVDATKIASDAVTTAKILDANVTSAKVSTAVKTHTINYVIEDLGAGVDITNRAIFFAPTGTIITVVDASMIPLGAGAGIDDANNCIVGIGNGVDSIAYVAYDTAPGYPAEGVVSSLGALDVAKKVLTAGQKLTVTVTNGATANPPSMMLQVSYTIAEA